MISWKVLDDAARHDERGTTQVRISLWPLRTTRYVPVTPPASGTAGTVI